MASTNTALPITLIGLGSIGISFAALYLKHSAAAISVYDPRHDLNEHVRSVLPVYLDTQDPDLSVDNLISTKRLRICSSLEDACRDARIVQEQGPENLAFKTSIWKLVTRLVSSDTHLWSSTSGIPASQQIEVLEDKSRLLVLHPFNPAHIMPLLEIVPSPSTLPHYVDFARSFFHSLESGHRPVVLKKETPGFVGNRLAFVLLREACHLVSKGVVSVEDLDTIVEASIGPRWAVTGPFKSYNYGGGTKGLGAFFQNLSGTIESIWDDAGQLSFKNTEFLAMEGADPTKSPGETDKSWAASIVQQTTDTYGLPTAADFAKRDQALKTLMQARETKGDPSV